jgi:hypothetical protein
MFVKTLLTLPFLCIVQTDLRDFDTIVIFGVDEMVSLIP